MTANEAFVAWVGGSLAGGVVAGLVGRRWQWMRWTIVVVGPVYSLGWFLYGLFAGGPNECVPSASRAGFTCHPTAAIAALSWFGVLIVLLTVVLTLSPVTSVFLRSRQPAVLGLIGLVILHVLFVTGLLVWVPATADVLAAAIAGPPRRARPAPQSVT